MSYYWFNRQEILFLEKVAQYYAQNNEAMKEKSRERYEDLSQEKKTKLRSTKENNIKNWLSIKKSAENSFLFFA